MTFGEFKRLAKKGGCYKDSEGTRHEIWYSPITGNYFPVGRHNKKEVPKGTLGSMLSQAGLTIK